MATLNRKEHEMAPVDLEQWEALENQTPTPSGPANANSTDPHQYPTTNTPTYQSKRGRTDSGFDSQHDTASLVPSEGNFFRAELASEPIDPPSPSLCSAVDYACFWDFSSLCNKVPDSGVDHLSNEVHSSSTITYEPNKVVVSPSTETIIPTSENAILQPYPPAIANTRMGLGSNMQPTFKYPSTPLQKIRPLRRNLEGDGRERSQSPVLEAPSRPERLPRDPERKGNFEKIRTRILSGHQHCAQNRQLLYFGIFTGALKFDSSWVYKHDRTKMPNAFNNDWRIERPTYAQLKITNRNVERLHNSVCREEQFWAFWERIKLIWSDHVKCVEYRKKTIDSFGSMDPMKEFGYETKWEKLRPTEADIRVEAKIIEEQKLKDSVDDELLFWVLVSSLNIYPFCGDSDKPGVDSEGKVGLGLEDSSASSEAD